MTDKINISAEAVAAMLNGVTPGPWAAVGRFVDTHVLQIADLNAGRTGHEDANTRFIAWAREAVPALAARLAEVEAGLKHYKHEVVETALANEADAEARAEAAEAKLSEAVKAGMLRAIGIAYVTCAETTDETPVDAVADAIETAASDPETISRIVAQLKEGRE